MRSLLLILKQSGATWLRSLNLSKVGLTDEFAALLPAWLAGSNSDVNATPSILAMERWIAVSRSAASWCSKPVSWSPQSSCS